MNDKYTETEKTLILKTKEIVRLDPEFKDDFDLENDEHIIKGIKLYKSKYHMSTPNQMIAVEIFRKNGLWKHGKITLDERDQQILDEKIGASIAYKQAVMKKKNRLTEFKHIIDAKLQDIEDLPMKVTSEMDKKRHNLQDRVYTQLNGVQTKLIDNLSKVMKDSIKEFRREQAIILTNLKTQLTNLKQEERFKIDSILKEYDELIIMQREYAQISNKCDSEIESAEKRIEVTDIKLFDMTVKELKVLAEKKGIIVPTRVLKADLITLIERG